VFVPVIAPLVLKDLRYDPAKDLVPVAQVAKYEFAFGVAANHPARTVAEFVAWARANPAQASVGNSAPGSLPHFLGFMLGQATAVDLVHVPYKGVAQIENELMGRQIAAGIGTITDLAPLHRAGKLRVLAVTGAKRSALLPEVPTFREQGYPSVDAAGWHGIFAPGGTPQPAIDRLSAAIVAALQSREMRAKFVALGLDPTGTTPKELAAIIATDAARWAPIVKKAGFSAE
jgi:tripartite-type tricarboxylate transporter receptor subunit TctC